MQAPLWIEQLYLPDKPIANTGILVTFTGQLDASTFVEAVRIVVNETDTLRIRLNMEGDSVYQKIVELPDYVVQQIDFSNGVFGQPPAGDPDLFVRVGTGRQSAARAHRSLWCRGGMAALGR